MVWAFTSEFTLKSVNVSLLASFASCRTLSPHAFRIYRSPAQFTFPPIAFGERTCM